MLELRNMDSESTSKPVDYPRTQAADFIMRYVLFVFVLAYLAYNFR